MQLRPLVRLAFCLLLLLNVAPASLAQTASGTVNIQVNLSDRIRLVDNGPVTIRFTELANSNDEGRWVEAEGKHELEYQCTSFWWIVTSCPSVRVEARNLPEEVTLRATAETNPRLSGNTVELSNSASTLISGASFEILLNPTQSVDVRFEGWASR